MPYCTANNLVASSAVIHMPRTGVWHADLSLVADSVSGFAPGDPVLIDVQSSWIWRGTVRRAGMSRGVLFVRVVGGGGGLITALTARAYRSVPLRIPLLDILSASNEVLSPLADASMMGHHLERYSRVNQLAGEALGCLVQAVDANWRILRDGTVWIGQEAWKPRIVDYTLMAEEPTIGRAKLAALPELVPGDMLDGRKVSYVEHTIDPRAQRTHIWVED